MADKRYVMADKRTGVWEVGITIVLPTYTLEVESDTREDAIERALSVLNESGDIPEHRECDVDIRLKHLYTTKALQEGV